LQAGTLNFGSHIELNGSSATNANDFRIGHGTSLEIIAYDYSAGQLTLKSGGASPAVAVTIDNSQHVIFEGNVGVGGTAIPVTTSSNIIWLDSDSFVQGSNDAIKIAQLGSNIYLDTTWRHFDENPGSVLNVGSGTIRNYIATTPAVVAATALVASTEYRILTVGTTDFTLVGAASNTVGELFTATGAGTGTGTASEAAASFLLALDIDETDSTFNNNVTITGAFTSLGIDDNATGERIQVGDSYFRVGTTSTNYIIVKPDSAAGLIIGGGDDAGDGADLIMYGSTHATTGDFVLRSGGNEWMRWDESLGAYTVSTGIGAKTLALTINSTQDFTLAGTVAITGNLLSVGVNDSVSGNIDLFGGLTGNEGGQLNLYTTGDFDTTVNKWFLDAYQANFRIVADGPGVALTIDSSRNSIFAGAILSSASTATRAGLNIAEGVAPTTPVDGDVWVTAAGAFNARLNGVTVDLSATGGGGGYTVTTQTGTSYTASAGDCVLATNTGTVTITLPVPAADDTIIVKKTGATGTVNVTPASGDNIDGSTAAYAMSTQYESVTLISDGTDWFVV
jgi:hypothetical protein